MPKPILPEQIQVKKQFQSSILNNILNQQTPTIGQGFAPLIPPNLHAKRNHNCYIKDDNIVYFWADRLLHKHHISDHDDFFIIIPNESSTTDKLKLEIKIFCSEYDEWETQYLTMNIKNDA